MKTQSIIAGLGVVWLLVACHPKERPAHADATSAPPAREETRGIRNTRSVGSAGDDIADRLDAAFGAGDASRQRLDEAERAQTP